MYELADRPPKAGSLKEALLLSVWLKRQEIELAKWRVVAQGAANAKEVGTVYGELVEAVFPFAKGFKRESDKKLVEMMKKEIAKGPIVFRPLLQQNPFKDKVQRMAMPDATLAKFRKNRGKQ